MSASPTAPGRITHLVGHQSWHGEPGRTSEVYNPATGEVLAEVADGTVEDGAAEIAVVVGALHARNLPVTSCQWQDEE